MTYGFFLGKLIIVLAFIITAVSLIYVLFEIEKTYRFIFMKKEDEDHFAVLDEEKRKSQKHIVEIKKLYVEGKKEEMLSYIEKSQREYYDEELASFDLEILNIILQRYLHICKSNDIKFTYDIQKNVRTLLDAAEFSGEQLCTVLGNLIDNAIDALKTYEGDRRIELMIKGNGHQVLVEVKNSGDPIPQQHLEKIFNYGFSTKADGRGSGLFIVYKLIEKIGASLSVESNDEHTSFKVILILQ
jgi:sensor histidine kinase regulating citrate/malate metabolism